MLVGGANGRKKVKPLNTLLRANWCLLGENLHLNLTSEHPFVLHKPQKDISPHFLEWTHQNGLKVVSCLLCGDSFSGQFAPADADQKDDRLNAAFKGSAVSTESWIHSNLLFSC